MTGRDGRPASLVRSSGCDEYLTVGSEAAGDGENRIQYIMSHSDNS